MPVKLPKYCQRRDSKKDGTYYAHQPSPDMKRLLNVKYKVFRNISDLSDYAFEINQRLDNALRKERKSVTVDPQSVRGLVHHYYGTTHFLKLKPNSQSDYKLLLEFGMDFMVRSSNKTFGEYQFKAITREYVDKLNVEITHKHGKHRVYHVNKVFRRVYNVGIKHSRVNFNPFTLQELEVPVPNKGQGRGIWSDKQLEDFISKADELGHHSIGTIALFCNTLCQRPGDMRNLKNSDIKDGILTFTQQKSISHKGIPNTLDFDMRSPSLKILVDRLNFVRERELEIKARIDAGETLYTGNGLGKRKRFCCIDDRPEGFLINYETTGTGLSKHNVIYSTDKVRSAAGIPQHLQMRDNRATGATRLGLNRLSGDEIMSVTGHRDPKMVQVYLRAASKMRSNALNKVFG